MYYPKDGWTFTFGDVTFNGKMFDKMMKPQKPNNNAPKTIKGDYDLSIHGNKIVLVDNADGTTVESKCHPDDNFDIGDGIKQAFNKLNEERKKQKELDKKINIGDYIKVIVPSKAYVCLSDFFKENNLMDYASYYRYGVSPHKGIKGKVIFCNNNFVVIQVPKDIGYGESSYMALGCPDSIYVVHPDGVQKA